MYAKLFTSIYQGTLRGNSHGLLVFTNLLAHADQSGHVDMHFRAIADEVGLSVDEVKAACREWVASNPRKMPNEGDILGLIGKARAFKVARLPKPSEPREEYRGGNAPTPEQKEKANELLQKMGFAPKRFGGEA
jgi:hypothetical protein